MPTLGSHAKLFVNAFFGSAIFIPEAARRRVAEQSAQE
jgi:hypothetical protein